MNNPADYAWVATETPPPIAVADDADRMRPCHAIILRRNRPAQRRIYAQHLIIAPAHELPIERWFRLPIHTHGQSQRMVGKHAGEHPVVIPELLVSDVGEAVAASKAADVTEQDESLRIIDRQRFQQHGVNQAEDRRVGSDAQRQRERGHASKAAMLQQHPRGITQVLKHLILQASCDRTSLLLRHSPLALPITIRASDDARYLGRGLKRAGERDCEARLFDLGWGVELIAEHYLI